jgi:serine/threonine protein kinase
MRAARVLVAGETVQHYRILEKIGEGGMGVVYKALDTRLDRPVAIKVLHATSDESRRLQFAWEARAAASLRHPHIVVIHDIVSDTGADSIVMEYIPGRPLSHDLERGPISIPETIGMRASWPPHWRPHTPRESSIAI